MASTLHFIKSSLLAIFLLLLIAHCFARRVTGQKDDMVGTNSDLLITTKLENVQQVNLDEISNFYSDVNVRIVYFYQKDFVRLSSFLKEYEKSASFLLDYGVKCAVADCRQEAQKPVSYCSEKNAEKHVFAFKGGHMLLQLALENMFDVNSILSNILQIVLLKEVPIVQQAAERIQQENDAKGSSDLIFSYQEAIGTLEHRVLMEIAFAYHHQYKFAITTEKNVCSDLPEFKTNQAAQLWLLKCKNVPRGAGDTPCQYVKYRDALQLVPLARFLRLLDTKLIHDAAADGVDNPFIVEGLHTAIVAFDKSTDDTLVNDLADRIVTNFMGLVGVILVNLSSVERTEYDIPDSIMKYPAVGVLRVGETETAFMEEEATEDSLEAFLSEKIQNRKGGSSPKGETSKDEIAEDDEAATFEDGEGENDADQQDDQVEDAVYKLRKTPLNKQHITVLTDKTFPVQTSDSDFLVVLFYLSFDGKSMAFMHSYAEAAEEMAKQDIKSFAEVNCFDWTDVCGKVNITSYPTIRFYRKGKEPIEYKGFLGKEPIMRAVKLYMMQSPVTLESESDTDMFLSLQEHIGTQNFPVVGVLGMLSQQSHFDAFNEAASYFRGTAVFGLATKNVLPLLKTKFSTDGDTVVIHKPHDTVQTYAVYNGEMSASNIKEAVLTHGLPVFPQLKPANFPAYFAKKKPFVILFDKDVDSKEGAFKVMSEIARGGQLQHLTLGWMDINGPHNTEKRILEDYNPTAQVPAIVMVNHAKNCLYNYEASDITEEIVIKWIKDIENNQILPTKMLRDGQWLPRHKGYDFLELMDDEQKNPTPVDKSFIDTANEYGIGFDEDGNELPADDFQKHERSFNEKHKIRQPSDDAEQDIRKELKDLRKSRLFHSLDERTKHASQKSAKQSTDDMPKNDAAKHTEL